VLQSQADAAVVWLGGNEFRANYGFLYDGGDPVPLVNSLSNDLAEVLDFVLAQKAGIKLVVVNLPDLGATPDKQAAHPDAAKRANVTAATVLANQAIANLAATRGIAVADAFSETRNLVNGETIWIGPVNIFAGSHPDNHPRHAFTRDGLPPSQDRQPCSHRLQSVLLHVHSSPHRWGNPGADRSGSHATLPRLG